MIRKETQGVTEYAGLREPKKPDETSGNRNAETQGHTGAMSLRTKDRIPGTSRIGLGAIRRVRPVELYFFAAFGALGCLLPEGSCGPEASPAPLAAATTPVPAPTPTEAPNLFASSVRPVLLAHCAPCHEPGGKMYERLPFDQPTVVASHSAGVLRRLKGEDREAVERWLATVAEKDSAGH